MCICPRAAGGGGAGPPAAPQTGSEGEPSSQTLEDVEKIHIHRVMLECAGNKTEAAKRLGLSLRSLYRRLDKLGITA